MNLEGCTFVMGNIFPGYIGFREILLEFSINKEVVVSLLGEFPARQSFLGEKGLPIRAKTQACNHKEFKPRDSTPHQVSTAIADTLPCNCRHLRILLSDTILYLRCILLVPLQLKASRRIGMRLSHQCNVHVDELKVVDFLSFFFLERRSEGLAR